MAEDNGVPVEKLNGGGGFKLPALLSRSTKEAPSAGATEKVGEETGVGAKVSHIFDQLQSKVTSTTQSSTEAEIAHPPVGFATMNWVDWSIVLCLLVSLVISIMRGAMREVISIVSWLLGIWLAFHFSTEASDYLSTWIHSSTAKVAVSVALLILFALVCGKVLQVVVSKCIEWGGLSGLDRFVGFWFGLLRGILCVTLFLMLAKTIDLHHTMAWHNATLIPYFDPIMDWFVQWVPEKMHHLMVFLGVSVDMA